MSCRVLPAGAVFFCASHDALIWAQGSAVAVPVGVVVGVPGAVVVVLVTGAMQEQALEILADMTPLMLSLQPSAAYEGTAVGATVPVACV